MMKDPAHGDQRRHRGDVHAVPGPRCIWLSAIEHSHDLAEPGRRAAVVTPRAASHPGSAGRPADADALARALSNPVAALISVPFQLNYDTDYGADGDGERWTLNVQPVVPISLNEDWNVISRTILPVVYQERRGSATAAIPASAT